jgi:Domain of unknown function (DUF4328)
MRPPTADTPTMRTGKTAASSADACCRCTALLPSGVARCSLCGWPAGVGFPPAEGELTTTTPVDEVEPEVEAAPDHAQLDALAGIAERQAPRTEEPAEPVPAPPADVSEVPVEADVEEPADVTNTEPAPVPEAVDAVEQLDPLTAPLETLIQDVEPQSVNDVVETDDTSPDPGTPGRTFDVQRLTQVLVMAAALSNLALVGLEVIAEGSMAVLALALVSLGIWTAAAVTFLHWVSRTYARVVTASPVRQRHGAVMAVAGWMIPIAGILIGYRVLQDLWTGSDPSTRDNPEATPAKARLIDVWLLGLVTATVFGYAMPLALGDSALWGVLSSVGVLTAAVALIQVISTLGAWSTDVGSSTEETESADPVDAGTVTTRVDHLEAVVPEPVPEPESVSID